MQIAKEFAIEYRTGGKHIIQRKKMNIHIVFIPCRTAKHKPTKKQVEGVIIDKPKKGKGK